MKPPPAKLEFTIPGRPQTKQRPRVVQTRQQGSRVMTYTPKKTRDYEQKVRICAAAALQTWRTKELRAWPALERYRVRIIVFLDDKRRRDLDNLCKSIMDGLDPLMADDSQIDDLHMWRLRDDKAPRAQVLIEVIG